MHLHASSQSWLSSHRDQTLTAGQTDDLTICNRQYCITDTIVHTHTHTHTFSGPLSGTTRVSRYQKGKTNLDFTEARDSEWQWHQLDCMQVCTSQQTDNHASTPPLSFFTSTGGTLNSNYIDTNQRQSSLPLLQHLPHSVHL